MEGKKTPHNLIVISPEQGDVSFLFPSGFMAEFMSLHTSYNSKKASIFCMEACLLIVYLFSTLLLSLICEITCLMSQPGVELMCHRSGERQLCHWFFYCDRESGWQLMIEEVCGHITHSFVGLIQQCGLNLVTHARTGARTCRCCLDQAAGLWNRQVRIKCHSLLDDQHEQIDEWECVWNYGKWAVNFMRMWNDTPVMKGWLHVRIESTGLQ